MYSTALKWFEINGKGRFTVIAAYFSSWNDRVGVESKAGIGGEDSGYEIIWP